MIKAILISLVIGAAATTSAEYFFKYNLIDLIKDKILGLFGKAKAEVAVVAADVAKKV